MPTTRTPDLPAAGRDDAGPAAAEPAAAAGAGAPEVCLAGRLLDAVAAAGTHTVFGLPGVHNLAFWRELAPGRPRIVGVRHEQATAYAADGLARATGGLGVALTTTGPGAANAVAAFGEAAASRSPVLLLATEIPGALARPGVVRGVLHESLDQAALFAPLAKAVYRPRTVGEVVRDVAAAIATALAAPRGPVYLDVPTDLLGQPAPEIRPAAGAGPLTDPAGVGRLVQAVDDAEQVVLWAGGGVHEPGGQQALGRLAERIGAPVVTSWAGRGALAPEHPWLVGRPPHEPAVARLVGGADLLLAVGCRLDATTTRNWTMPMSRRLAQVNVDPAAFDTNYRTDVAVHGDAAATLTELAARVARRSTPNPVPQIRAAVDERLAADPEAVEPLALVAAIERAVGPDTFVVSDMCIPGYWWGGYGAVAGPRRLQYPIGWGTLGYAVPAAIGAASVGPTLVVCGDGGLSMSVGELATYVQEQLPVTILLVDDGGYGMLRYDQQRLGDPLRGVDLHGPDWAALGAAYGVPTTVLDRIDDRLAPALRDGLRTGRPHLVVLHARLVPPVTTSPRWRD
ncbi:MAG: thiamine pyrophosphate-binding protein [Geodermatophilaceae bacterium]